MGIIDDLIPNMDEICGIRDDLGVALKEVWIVTRTWSGSAPGDGTKTDVRVRMLPSPRVVEFLDEYKLREGGAVKQGDIMLKMISKESFPTRESVDCSTSSKSVEKFYEVGGFLYRVIAVREKHVVWQVQLRRVSAQ